MLRFREMSEGEFRAFIERSDRDYAADHVRAGTWASESALELARAETAKLLPRGRETPDAFLRAVEDRATGARLGEVWYALEKGAGRSEVRLYWIGIDPEHRRRGHATAVLHEVEREARRLGAGRIALHVFAENTAARALYAKLGYHPRNVTLSKDLAL